MQTWFAKASVLVALSMLAACGGGGSTSGTGGSGGAGSSANTSSATGMSTSSSGAGGGGQGSAARVDLVMGVDNSRSMADKQAVLALALGSLISGLTNPLCVDASNVPVKPQPASGSEACPAGSTREFAPVTDMHIGVVTSSLGGHGADACAVMGDNSCGNGMNPSNNDAGHLISRADACGGASVPTYQSKGFLAWDPGQKLLPPGEADASKLAKSFIDLVIGAGQIGCGYESQLESWYRFLIDPEPYQTVSVVNGSATLSGIDAVLLQQRAEFLRPDSLLGIMMLTDEDDCSTKEGGQFFYSNQQRNPANPAQTFHLPRARAECAVNPNDLCCKSCGQPAGNCPPDPTCVSSPVLNDQEDNINLRCWDQKRRFGVDFLYPVDRYAHGLTAALVPDRMGNMVPNPIFSDLNPQDPIKTIRTPNMVFLMGIVGVPWQDVAVDPKDLTKGYKDAAALGKAVNGVTGWDVILGDPATYVAPKDPLMIPSVQPRSGTNPVTGDPLAPPNQPLGNPINGNEYSIPKNNDLQYACVFPLLTPRDCSVPGLMVCDCSDPNNDNPLCAANPNNGGLRTLQVKTKAYPGQREINVLKLVGDQGVVTSICPSQGGDPTKADYAYLPAVRAFIDRVKPRLK